MVNLFESVNGQFTVTIDKELVKHLGWKKESMKHREFNEYKDISWGQQINPLTINLETMSNSFSLNKIKINDTSPRKEGHEIIFLNPNVFHPKFSILLYENGPMAFGFWEWFIDLSNSNNAYQIQAIIVETTMAALGVSIDSSYVQFRDKLIKALNAAKSSSARSAAAIISSKCSTSSKYLSRRLLRVLGCILIKLSS
jgi:hypothetical protein